MTNQTRVGIDKKYPPRLRLPELKTYWNFQLKEYPAPICPDFATVQERLAAKGVEIADEAALRELGRLTTSQATEQFGEAVAQLRHPLGRTGLNGTGIFYEAGASHTADLALMRVAAEGLQIALVYNRGKWRLPGGFADPEDGGVSSNTAVREGEEELGLPLTQLATGRTTIIAPEHPKPNSSRSVDMGYILNQVDMFVLPDPAIGDEISREGGDDAERAGWYSYQGLEELRSQGQISGDHLDYAALAFKEVDLAA